VRRYKSPCNHTEAFNNNCANKADLELAVETESPLNQIQQAEAEVIRRVAVAKEAARLAEISAHEDADSILQEAQRSGYREGEAECERIIAEAQAEAKNILEKAHQQAEALRRDGEAHKESIVNRAVNIVLGLGKEVEPP